MTRHLGCFAGLGLAVLMTGCASTSERLPPSPPSTIVPDLRGIWSGLWGGTPLTLVVVDQKEMAAYSGIYLGPLQVLGRRAPGVNGVMTSTIRGAAVSVSVEGWYGSTSGGLMLVLRGVMPNGTQQLTLTRIEAEQLAGTGESSFRWGPQGPVNLTRRSSTQAPAN